MKKFTLLIVSLLTILGGVKAQNLSQGKTVIPIGETIEGVTQEGLQQLTDGNLTNYYNFNHYVAKTEEVEEVSETQSWYIDLGAENTIGRIVIYWEGACAKAYKVYGGNSIDDIANDNWGTELVNETNCIGGNNANQTKIYPIENKSFRYIKFKAGALHEKEWGCKMGEFIVKGTQPSSLGSVNMYQIYKNTENISFTPTLLDEDGMDYTGNVTYSCGAEGFSYTNNVLSFNNTPDGVYTLTISDDNTSIEKKIAFVTNSPEDPTEFATNVKSVFCDKYGSEEPGLSNSDWNGGYTDIKKLEMSPNNYAYFVSNVGTFGLNGGGDADIKKLIFDIYVVEDIKGHVVIEGANYNSGTLTYTGGKWNHFALDLPEGLDYTKATWIQFYIDNKCDILLDNVFYTKATDDGEDPVLSYANTYNTTVASASFRLRATDNSDELSFKVVVEDTEGNKISETTVNGGKEEDIYVSVKGLHPNTDYKAIATVSDMTRTSEAKELTFTTKQLTHAEKQASSKLYYENDQSTLRGMLNSITTGVDITIPEGTQISIGDNDNVLMFPVKENEVFGLNVKDVDEFRIDKKENIVGIAVYPVGTTTIQVSPRIYGVEDKFENRPVKENEWNYITMVPLKDYNGTEAFIGVALKSAEKGTVFLDNFYMYTTEDTQAPKVTLNDIAENDVHVNSVEISFTGSDETSSEVRYGIWVKNTTDNETEYRAGLARANSGDNVTYYLKGLKAGKTYEMHIRARDFSENEGLSKTKIFTTKSFTENISIESSTENPENGGIVVLKGKWNVEAFNNIAAKYPYGCFDVRNVQFEENMRHDRGENGIKLFNHNAYFITDITNNFDGNYAIPDEEGKLIGMNFQWFDGDFKPENGPVGYVKYKDIIDEYEKGGNKYPGVSGSGYIKMDPYTGNDLYFKEQGVSITRQMNIDKTLAGEGGANKYSTMICPFAMNTDKVENCEFFQLNTPSVDGESVTLNFTQVTGKTEANKPYLVRVKGDGNRGGTAYFVDNASDTEKKLSFSDIANKEEIDGKTAADGNITATLFGTYVTKTFTPETSPKTSEIYGLKQDNDKLTLVSSTVKSTLPAFRSAIKITGLTTNNAKNIVLSFDGETTGIFSINDDAMSSILDNVYSIDGKVVGNTSNGLISLPAGIYIVNGKRVVIK